MTYVLCGAAINSEVLRGAVNASAEVAVQNANEKFTTALERAVLCPVVPRTNTQSLGGVSRV